MPAEDGPGVDGVAAALAASESRLVGTRDFFLGGMVSSGVGGWAWGKSSCVRIQYVKYPCWPQKGECNSGCPGSTEATQNPDIPRRQKV